MVFHSRGSQLTKETLNISENQVSTQTNNVNNETAHRIANRDISANVDKLILFHFHVILKPQFGSASPKLPENSLES